MKRIKQPVLLLLIVITCVFMPLSCMPVVFVLNTVNPMQSAFITDFTVENQSGEDVQFTPIGTWGAEGNRATLPIFAVRFPAIHSLKTGNFLLKPGERRVVLYDWDDINLSEIAVRSQEGKLYQLVIDPTPTERQYHAPETNLFVIPLLSTLPTASESVEVAIQGSSKLWRFYAVMLCALALPFVLWRLVLAYRKEKRAAPQAAPPPSSLAAGSESGEK